MLYGPRADIRRIIVKRDEGENAISACIEVEMAMDMGGGSSAFYFSSFGRQPMRDGAGMHGGWSR